jgi:hypothetical protein
VAAVILIGKSDARSSCVARVKEGLLELAKQLGNVSHETIRQWG